MKSEVPEMPLDPPDNPGKIVAECELCGESLYEGDGCYDLSKLGLGVICESCMEEFHDRDLTLEDFD